MEEYRVDELKKYIEKTKMIEINDIFRIRLSEELEDKYRNGLYDVELANFKDCIREIEDLGIKYPANSRPLFYMYIVPDTDYVELLRYTSRSSSGGGKPVQSYDLDGFNSAYGTSSNMLEVKSVPSIMSKVNDIHELAHLVQSMFFYKNRYLQEGFAEALPLYTLDYESRFDFHRELLKSLDRTQILSAQELIEIEEQGNFNSVPLIKGTSCSFSIMYISSYLFVRGCMEIIEKGCKDRVEATQQFLEIIKQSDCMNQWLVFDIANAIGVSQEELLNGTDMQWGVIESLDYGAHKNY